jgi:hypothetical protein
MNPAANEYDDAVPRRRWRVRFSLLSLLVVVTLVCVVLGLMRRPGCRAVASFRVNAQQFSSAEGGSRFDAVEFEIFKRTQLEAIKSPWLMQAAIRDPVIATLPLIASHKDPVAWLQENIQADFPEQGEILTISLEGGRSQSFGVKQVVDAVAKAYREDSRSREKTEMLIEFQRATAHTSDMKRLYEARLRRAVERDPSGSDASATKVEEIELEMAQRQWADAAKREELLKADLGAPSRVEQIHEAIGTEWGFGFGEIPR